MNRIKKKKFTEKKEYVDINKTIKNQGSNVCPICTCNFYKKNQLIQHLLLHIPSDQLNGQINLEKSSNLLEITRELICNSCERKFIKKRELIKHLRTQHANLFKCHNKICFTRKIRRKNNQQDYEEILVDDGKKNSIEYLKKYKEISECPYCKTPFSMKKNLLKHMKIIHKITDHEVMVYEERKPKIGHRCAECEKIFSLRKNLYQHLRKIHGRTDVGRKSSTLNDSVRLICDACGIGFGEKKSLMRHLRMKHAVKIGREKKTVAICVHCNSTFAHKKSLYKHERKFHGADYKKIIKDYSKNDPAKKLKEKLEKLGKIDDYECLKNILPERSDYKLTQFAWLKSDNYGNWFKAKLYFFCESKDDVQRWKEKYEMLNKLCLRVLSFPRPRTPGVLYKGRFRCHHNTMPKKGAKPNPKHTACSAVLSITLLQSLQQKDNAQNSSMKALVFLKNTHNHTLGDPETLKYRKPIHEVKEKFLKLFEAKKTVPQALAIHKADLEAEYGPDRIQSIVNDRAFMPNARWAYGLYYTCFKKKRDENFQLDTVSSNTACVHSVDYFSPVTAQTAPVSASSDTTPNPPQDPYKILCDIFKSVCRQIADRYNSSPSYFYSGLQTFISVYETNCSTDAQLLAALQSFGKYSNSNIFRNRTSLQSRNTVGLQNTEFNNENSMTTALNQFTKYNNVPTNSKQRITVTRNNPISSTVLSNNDDLLTASTQSVIVPESHNGVEARTIYLETSKYDDTILYQIENRQNVTTNCWIPTEYAMF